MATNIPSDSSYSSYIPGLDKIDYEQFVSKDIPAVVFLSIVSIIGVVGNIQTLLVYATSTKMAKLTVRVFILWLSATDLVACIACMPFEIFDIRFSYTFSSAGACKFFRFLDHAVLLASGGILTAIAIQRLQVNTKLLPRPNGYSNIVLNIISAVIIGLATLLSTPAFVFYGLNKKETNFTQLVGTDCTVLSEYKHIKSVGFYTGIVILLSTVGCIICIVCYGKILYVICTQMKKNIHRNPKENKMNMSSVENSRDTEEVSVSQVFESPQNTDLAQKHDTSHPKIKSHERTGYEKGRQLTISLIVATAVSYIGYIIYVGTILVKITNPKLYNGSIRPATGVLLRTYFISNATNPIVFCLLDNTFREECLNLYSKTICLRKIRKT